MIINSAVLAAGIYKKALLVSAVLVLCTGCGKKEEQPSSTPATTPASATGSPAPANGDVGSTASITTGPGEQAADNQVEFYTERYLRAEERLKRRQDRLNAVLSQ